MDKSVAAGNYTFKYTYNYSNMDATLNIRKAGSIVKRLKKIGEVAFTNGSDVYYTKNTSDKILFMKYSISKDKEFTLKTMSGSSFAELETVINGHIYYSKYVSSTSGPGRKEIYRYEPTSKTIKKVDSNAGLKGYNANNCLIMQYGSKNKLYVYNDSTLVKKCIAENVELYDGFITSSYAYYVKQKSYNSSTGIYELNVMRYKFSDGSKKAITTIKSKLPFADTITDKGVTYIGANGNRVTKSF